MLSIVPSPFVQGNVFGRPARLFLMKAHMFGLPVRALHLYRKEAATFQVRVLDLPGHGHAGLR